LAEQLDEFIEFVEFRGYRGSSLLLVGGTNALTQAVKLLIFSFKFYMLSNI